MYFKKIHKTLWKTPVVSFFLLPLKLVSLPIYYIRILPRSTSYHKSLWSIDDVISQRLWWIDEMGIKISKKCVQVFPTTSWGLFMFIVFIKKIFLLNKYLTTPSRYLLAQCQQWKHQNNVKNLFKFGNKDIRTTSTRLFWCLYW